MISVENSKKAILFKIVKGLSKYSTGAGMTLPPPVLSVRMVKYANW